MKKIILSFALLIFFSHAHSQVAFGLRVGEPYGLNVKVYASENSALDIVVGGNYLKRSLTPVTDGLDYAFPSFMMNFVYQNSISRGGDMEFYIGGGLTYQHVHFLGTTAAALGEWSNRIILNLPIGLEYFVGGSNFSLYGEVKPALELIKAFGAFYPDAALGFRVTMGR